MAAAAPHVPAITEHDLLSFQISHFGDETQPETWFVDAATALQYEHAAEEDGLGYYEDGTKRTLTDAQIAMFRHSEIQHLLRERRLQREEQEYQDRRSEEVEERWEDAERDSEVSSLEDDLVGLAKPDTPVSDERSNTQPPLGRKRRRNSSSSVECDLPSRAQAEAKRYLHHQTSAEHRQPSQSSRSRSSVSHSTARSHNTGRRPRREEVPYEERHKRKWEDFIDENDPEQGSMTHRRIVRELDNMESADVEVDYGEDDAPAVKRAPQPAPPGRRVVSYDDH